MKLIDLNYFICDVMTRSLGFCPNISRPYWKRLIQQGAIHIEGRVEKNPSYEIEHFIIHNIRIGGKGRYASGVDVLLSDYHGGEDGDEERIFTKISGTEDSFRKDFLNFWNQSQLKLKQIFPILCLNPSSFAVKEGNVECEVVALKNRNYEENNLLTLNS